MDPTLILLVDAACNRLNPIADTGLDHTAKVDDLVGLASSIDAVPDSDFPLHGVSVNHARQLALFLRDNAARVAATKA